MSSSAHTPLPHLLPPGGIEPPGGRAAPGGLTPPGGSAPPGGRGAPGGSLHIGSGGRRAAGAVARAHRGAPPRLPGAHVSLTPREQYQLAAQRPLVLQAAPPATRPMRRAASVAPAAAPVASPPTTPPTRPSPAPASTTGAPSARSPKPSPPTPKYGKGPRINVNTPPPRAATPPPAPDTATMSEQARRAAAYMQRHTRAQTAAAWKQAQESPEFQAKLARMEEERQRRRQQQYGDIDDLMKQLRADKTKPENQDKEKDEGGA